MGFILSKEAQGPPVKLRRPWDREREIEPVAYSLALSAPTKVFKSGLEGVKPSNKES
jgi:hypothetical protein